ncbi:MAG TPA: 30S ribosomal protein S16 [Acidimicrobiia bacterium]|nr:30S ribosomal protein S16 [Acidimicrobiia bacterium]
MAVKMRLMRMGKTKSPHYRVVVIDGRAPRDGRYIDLIGRYDPREDPSVIEINGEKAVEWLRKGAQPTEAVSKLLEASGALTDFKVKSGRIHTVGAAAEAEAEREPEVAVEEAPAEEAAAPEEESAEEAPAEKPEAADDESAEVEEASETPEEE